CVTTAGIQYNLDFW
nr:immunoglobulin heavy chain junction region [Macaca mulatta]MOV38016.1 immunoglobulin heavy chain junction region [Macaca mulatta]MOV40318.1 immunoglobulin heavy chain junction region [Macaca mulatta]MOV41793.1 immunoglobulin heavy chain junction region [Macaca mulatta]MOV43680.1 immunoglobulin heavy chain junction region [Macaca mulatta]